MNLCRWKLQLHVGVKRLWGVFEGSSCVLHDGYQTDRWWTCICINRTQPLHYAMRSVQLNSPGFKLSSNCQIRPRGSNINQDFLHCLFLTSTVLRNTFHGLSVSPSGVAAGFRCKDARGEWYGYYEHLILHVKQFIHCNDGSFHTTHDKSGLTNIIGLFANKLVQISTSLSELLIYASSFCYLISVQWLYPDSLIPFEPDQSVKSTRHFLYQTKF